MRKLTIFSFAFLLLLGCKKKDSDNDTTTPSYPTDNLELPAAVRSLLLTNYGPSDQSSVGYEVSRLRNESSFGGNLNHLSLVVNVGNPLYSIMADTISTNFLSLGTPAFVVDFQGVSPLDLEDAVEAETMKNPILSVAHSVSSNDTAWVVDNKVKFFKDTTSSGIFIQTYLLGQIRAQDFGAVDLNAGIVSNLTKKVDGATLWDATVPNLDSSANAIEKNDDYYHNWVLLKGFQENKAWGVQLGTYWPFGPQFFENDVIGTADTPIRHYFLKPEKGDYPFEFSPQFITVVWILNPFTGNWEYVNSFQS